MSQLSSGRVPNSKGGASQLTSLEYKINNSAVNFFFFSWKLFYIHFFNNQLKSHVYHFFFASKEYFYLLHFLLLLLLQKRLNEVYYKFLQNPEFFNAELCGAPAATLASESERPMVVAAAGHSTKMATEGTASASAPPMNDHTGDVVVALVAKEPPPPPPTMAERFDAEKEVRSSMSVSSFSRIVFLLGAELLCIIIHSSNFGWVHKKMQTSKFQVCTHLLPQIIFQQCSKGMAGTSRHFSLREFSRFFEVSHLASCFFVKKTRIFRFFRGFLISKN